MLAAQRRRVVFGRLARNAFVVAALALSAGCATIIRGVTQDIQIATDPAGAVCELRKDDEVVDSVATTPGFVRVRKGLDAFVVACSRAGYLDATTLLDSGIDEGQVGSVSWGALSGLQGMTGPTLTATMLSTVMSPAAAAAGALWLGIIGAVSFVVDLASGAIFEYPEAVTLTLVPASFESPAARDKFFDGEQARLRTQYEERRTRVAGECRHISCPGTLASIDKAHAREIEELGRLRANARVYD